MSGRVTVFRTTPKIIMGAGAVAGLGQEAVALGAKKVLVVTDPGIIGVGLLDPVVQSLERAGMKTVVFSDVSPDPRYEIVQTCLSHIGGDKPDVVIGVGGGSSIDIAKCVSIMLTNEGTIYDYMGVDLVPKAGVPTIMVPTTAGTGSEVTSIAILSDEGEKLKKGVVSDKLFPRVALLDPELTLNLPPHITAATGMDALIHAIEAYTSVNATRITDVFALEAAELLFGNIRTAFAHGKNLQARGAMMEGSLYAGFAFANAGVTAVHAFAYPIGAEFHIPHGVANTLMLPPVMEFNMLGAMEKFATLSDVFGECAEGDSDRVAATKAVEAIKILAEDLKVPQKLSEFGVTDADIPRLAEGVMKVTRLLANNPRTLTKEDAEAIYRKVL